LISIQWSNMRLFKDPFVSPTWMIPHREQTWISIMSENCYVEFSFSCHMVLEIDQFYDPTLFLFIYIFMITWRGCDLLFKQIENPFIEGWFWSSFIWFGLLVLEKILCKSSFYFSYYDLWRKVYIYLNKI
jgi:hypothetical protein